MGSDDKREQIVEAAFDLFDRHGFNATGVEAIREQAKVSKRTLYKYFRSKDELVLAVLRRRDESFRNSFMGAVERSSSDPKERLFAVFDQLDAWFRSPEFRGCLFIKASSEFLDPESEGHATSAEAKRLMRRFLEKLADQAGANDPKALALELDLLVQGAIVLAHVNGQEDAARTAKDLARLVIDRAFAD